MPANAWLLLVTGTQVNNNCIAAVSAGQDHHPDAMHMHHAYMYTEPDNMCFLNTHLSILDRVYW